MERVTASWLHNGRASLTTNERLLTMDPSTMNLSEGNGSNPRPGRNYFSLDIRIFTSSNDVALKPTAL